MKIKHEHGQPVLTHCTENLSPACFDLKVTREKAELAAKDYNITNIRAEICSRCLKLKLMNED